MRDARYLRAQAELCLEIARALSDPKSAEDLRKEAGRYLAEAAQLKVTDTIRSSRPGG